MRFSLLRAIPLVAGFCLALTVLSCSKACAQNTTFQLPPPADAVEAMRRSYYAYDRSLPLNPVIKPLDTNASRARFHITYDSIHDQPVTTILALPKRFAPPYPVVILVHGLGGHKDSDYIRLCSEALTGQGYATLAVDSQYRGDRARPGRNFELHPDSFLTRDAIVQTVVDLRRAVDYLQTRPDIEKTKIGYLGFSMGGILGGILGGVEERIACFALIVPGGGLVNLAKKIDQYPLLKAHWPVAVTPEVIQRVEAIAEVIDPVYYVGRILPRPLLIVVAKHDEVIPAESSAVLVEASHAKAPEQVKYWDTGHAVNPTYLFDLRSFFVTQMGKRTPKVAALTP